MFRVFNLLLILTIVQFWWIAIWGIAYIIIDIIAGTSKIKELSIYGFMILFTIAVLHYNPQMIDRL